MKEMVTIDDLINAARQEKWELVDQGIPKVCEDSSVQERALKLLKDSDANIRDLGASILAKAHMRETTFSKMRPILGEMVTKDSNPYARYRAAFALVEHGVGEYREVVLRTLDEAKTDKDVGEIATKYLKRLT